MKSDKPRGALSGGKGMPFVFVNAVVQQLRVAPRRFSSTNPPPGFFFFLPVSVYKCGPLRSPTNLRFVGFRIWETITRHFFFRSPSGVKKRRSSFLFFGPLRRGNNMASPSGAQIFQQNFQNPLFRGVLSFENGQPVSIQVTSPPTREFLWIACPLADKKNKKKNLQ